MTRKAASVEKLDSRTPVQRRVQEVLVRRFAGSQTAMARQLRCSQAAISLVVNGHRQPRSQLLQAIASLPKVPADWLLRGHGELPDYQFPGDPDRSFVPLYAELEHVLGDDDQRRPPLLGYTVSPHDFSDSRFAFRIPAGHPCIQATRGRSFRAGDLLVFDRDPNVWIKRPAYRRNELYAIRGRDPVERFAIDLAYVERRPAGFLPSASAKRLVAPSPAVLRPDSTTLAARIREEEEIERWGRRLRHVGDASSSNVHSPDGRPVAPGVALPKAPRMKGEEIAINDMLAVVVLFIRDSF